MSQNIIKICSVDGCESKHFGRSFCRKHYERWKKHGDPLKTLRHSSPEESFAARTEWLGECLIFTGSLNTWGYGQLCGVGNGRYLVAHRYAWERVNGPIPDGMFVDHTCWNRACVNVDHLRIATPGENNWNRSGAEVGSLSGVRNVRKHRNKWQVGIQKDRVVHRFGSYDTIEEAAAVAEQARKDLFGEFAGKG